MHPRAPRDILASDRGSGTLLVHMARPKGGLVVREILDVQGFGDGWYNILMKLAARPYINFRIPETVCWSAFPNFGYV